MTTRTEEGTDRTCAGAPIRGATHLFSDDLIKGCEKFAASAKGAEDINSVRLFNTSCILFAVGAIEAKMNEWISLSAEIEDAKIPTAFWVELRNSQKSLPMIRKWNLIAAVHGGTCWDGGIEPFQSYDTIVALRNELIHFKGLLLGKDEAPNRRIEGLMTQLGIKRDATFVGDEVSSWVADLLSHRELGNWAQINVRPFYDNVLELILGHSQLLARR